MKNSYTCLVVGAGPSGTAAACTFARNGIDVCVIDKAGFPREKLCGGLLTNRTRKHFLEVFDADWEDMYECSSNGALFFHKGGADQCH
jgi:flavin-dependent dehydrogenase